jgi:hypothetical protein
MDQTKHDILYCVCVPISEFPGYTYIVLSGQLNYMVGDDDFQHIKWFMSKLNDIVIKDTNQFFGPIFSFKIHTYSPIGPSSHVAPPVLRPSLPHF